MSADHETARQIAKLERDLRDQIHRLRESLCAGGCASLEEYRHVVGRLQGLGTAVQLLEEHLLKQETED